MIRNRYRDPVLYWLLILLLGLILVLVTQPLWLTKKTSDPADPERERRARQEETYRQALLFLDEADYEQARPLFSSLKQYRNAETLYHYANAAAYYLRQDYLSYVALYELEKIPLSYRGSYAEEIQMLREETESNREQLLNRFYAEVERRIMESRENGTPSWPYVGMPEEQILRTGLGPYHSTKQLFDTTFYYWQSTDSVYYAAAEDGVIIRTGTTESGSRAKKSSASKKSSAESDPYHAKDYTHADDFYYDHWDDFIDFEDAENYYDEHN